ncbi:MAG: sigma-54 dependent transcriptional regulator [Pseudomonadota bacterium]
MQKSLSLLNLVGSSQAIENVRQLIHQVAGKDVTVLITGESGTGKEVVAKNLHRLSTRGSHPFVPVNCGAIPAELLESELFGHEKGAFTGAIASRQGRFEIAEGGTLFLDEIGDMPLMMQVKLLRVLQERTFERVGGQKIQQSDVRIIAATHRDLESAITESLFREDLYYRLNVFPIEMPALRDRISDLPILIEDFLTKLHAEHRAILRFTDRCMDTLADHHWPGNVRELANLIERLLVTHPGKCIDVHELPARYQTRLKSRPVDNAVSLSVLNHETHLSEENDFWIKEQLPLHGIDLKEYLSQLECRFIQQALDDADGIVAHAADRLRIRRTTLVEKMRKYELQRRDVG